MLLIPQKTATIMKKMEKVKKQKRLQKEQSSRKECHDGKQVSNAGYLEMPPKDVILIKSKLQFDEIVIQHSVQADLVNLWWIQSASENFHEGKETSEAERANSSHDQKGNLKLELDAAKDAAKVQLQLHTFQEPTLGEEGKTDLHLT